MNYWIFQVNPTKFKLPEALDSTKTVHWPIREKNLIKEYKVGDKVFIWRSDGGNRGSGGVFAIGEIIGDTIYEELGDKSYWYEQRTGKEYNVPLNIIESAQEPHYIGKSYLQEHAMLQGMEILSNSTRSSYRISLNEAEKILELWGDRDNLIVSQSIKGKSEKTNLDGSNIGCGTMLGWVLIPFIMILIFLRKLNVSQRNFAIVWSIICLIFWFNIFSSNSDETLQHDSKEIAVESITQEIIIESNVGEVVAETSETDVIEEKSNKDILELKSANIEYEIVYDRRSTQNDFATLFLLVEEVSDDIVEPLGLYLASMTDYSDLKKGININFYSEFQEDYVRDGNYDLVEANWQDYVVNNILTKEEVLGKLSVRHEETNKIAELNETKTDNWSYERVNEQETYGGIGAIYLTINTFEADYLKKVIQETQNEYSMKYSKGYRIYFYPIQNEQYAKDMALEEYHNAKYVSQEGILEIYEPTFVDFKLK